MFEGVFKPLLESKERIEPRRVEKEIPCIGNIRGQQRAKLGLLYASIGGHNVLLIGPPGEGKSYIISTLRGFLPPLLDGDYYGLNNIYRDTNLKTPDSRPVIEVSPNTTPSNLLGGGITIRPGAISLAHTGVLFMDELPEYDRKVLESLRTPMEAKDIAITRKGETKVYDCAFQLIAAMNPCPCGRYPSESCVCTSNIITRYQNKLSGPMLDRIDMIITMNKLTAEEKFKDAIPRQSEYLNLLVLRAINFRLRSRKQVFRNTDIPGHDTFNANSRHLRYGVNTIKVFQEILNKRSFSSRKAIRLARLSRTIADTNRDESISPQHLKSALSFLTNDLIK